MRTLNRPMFRTGGSAGTGITSGLAPRQGYNQGYRATKISDLGSRTIGELEDIARASTRGDRRADMNQFLIDYGLNLVSGTPRSNIFATLAEEAKGPLATMQKSRMSRGAAESDMFATLFKGAADATTGGKTFAHRDKAVMIRENMQKQFDLQNKLANLEPNDLNRKQIENDIRTLKKQIRSPEFAETIKMMFSDERERRELNSLIVEQVRQENTGLDEDSVEFKTKVWQLKKKVFEGLEFGMLPEFKAEGGRMGYREGMSVMPTAMPAQEQTMPEELNNVSYDELRARLPQEVSDEVVQLLANSAEALEDFATIQTEQDIANFNKKYGVNLVLPAEG